LSSVEAPTAERASRKPAAYGLTRRRCRAPKLLMARAAAPILRGLRGRTNTTTSWSSSEILPGKPPFYDKEIWEGRTERKAPGVGRLPSELNLFVYRADSFRRIMPIRLAPPVAKRASVEGSGTDAMVVSPPEIKVEPLKNAVPVLAVS